MPAGEQISGVDGIFELIDAGTDEVIGEIPCLQSWNLDANAALSERGERCMKSNGDDEELVTAAVAATGSIVLGGLPSDGDSVTIAGVTYTFRTTPSTTGDVGIGSFGDTPAKIGITIGYLVDAISGVGTYNPTAHPTISADSAPAVGLDPTTTALLEAITAGAAGNSLTLTKFGTNITVSGATLSGGADAVYAPANLYKSQAVVSKSWGGTAEFFWQENQSIPAALSLDPTNVGDLLKVKLYPNDRAAGKILYSGTVRLESVTATAEAAGDVKTSVTFKGTGALVSSEYA